VEVSSILGGNEVGGERRTEGDHVRDLCRCNMQVKEGVEETGRRWRTGVEVCIQLRGDREGDSTKKKKEGKGGQGKTGSSDRESVDGLTGYLFRNGLSQRQ